MADMRDQAGVECDICGKRFSTRSHMRQHKDYKLSGILLFFTAQNHSLTDPLEALPVTPGVLVHLL